MPALLTDRYHFKKWPKRAAALLLDLAGWVFFAPCRMMRRPWSVRPRMKILTIRMDQMGDIVMVKPALEALFDSFPDAEIDFLTSEEGAVLFEDDKRFHEVIAFKNNWFNHSSSRQERKKERQSLLKKIKERRYDLAIDFRGDLRIIWMMKAASIPHRLGYGMTGGSFLLTYCGDYDKHAHQVINNINLLKGLGVDASAGTCVRPFILDQTGKFNDNDGLRRLSGLRIIIHPAAGRPEKVWSHERYCQLIERVLQKTDASIILIGTEKERASFQPACLNTPKVTDLRGKTSLKELASLFLECDLFVGCDSGPAHLAACQSLPVISIFQGPDDPDVWHPWSQQLELIHKPAGDSPSVEEVFSVILKTCAALKGKNR